MLAVALPVVPARPGRGALAPWGWVEQLAGGGAAAGGAAAGGAAWAALASSAGDRGQGGRGGLSRRAGRWRAPWSWTRFATTAGMLLLPLSSPAPATAALGRCRHTFAERGAAEWRAPRGRAGRGAPSAPAPWALGGESAAARAGAQAPRQRALLQRRGAAKAGPRADRSPTVRHTRRRGPPDPRPDPAPKAKKVAPVAPVPEVIEPDPTIESLPDTTTEATPDPTIESAPPSPGQGHRFHRAAARGEQPPAACRPSTSSPADEPGPWQAAGFRVDRRSARSAA